MPRYRARLTGEGGFSLIELLVTLVIMGVAFTALIGGTLTGVLSSDLHRRAADAEIVLRHFAEDVKAGGFHENCGDYVPVDPPWAEGFVLGITPDIPDTQPDPQPPADPDGCRELAEGLQRLTLRVTTAGPDGAPSGRGVETVQVMKRKAS